MISFSLLVFIICFFIQLIYTLVLLIHAIYLYVSLVFFYVSIEAFFFTENYIFYFFRNVSIICVSLLSLFFIFNGSILSFLQKEAGFKIYLLLLALLLFFFILAFFRINYSFFVVLCQNFDIVFILLLFVLFFYKFGFNYFSVHALSNLDVYQKLLDNTISSGAIKSKEALGYFKDIAHFFNNNELGFDFTLKSGRRVHVTPEQINDYLEFQRRLLVVYPQYERATGIVPFKSFLNRMDLHLEDYGSRSDGERLHKSYPNLFPTVESGMLRGEMIKAHTKVVSLALSLVLEPGDYDHASVSIPENMSKSKIDPNVSNNNNISIPENVSKSKPVEIDSTIKPVAKDSIKESLIESKVEPIKESDNKSGKESDNNTEEEEEEEEEQKPDPVVPPSYYDRSHTYVFVAGVCIGFLSFVVYRGARLLAKKYGIDI